MKRSLILWVVILCFALASCSPQPYIGSRQSNKYHLPSCFWAGKINPSNKITFASEDEARKAGYTPCSICLPGK